MSKRITIGNGYSFKLQKKVFYHAQSDLLLDEYIIVMASNWKKNVQTDEWEELCWKTEDMQATYDHESQHIRNARAMLEFLFHHFMITSDAEDIKKFRSEEKCLKKGQKEMLGHIKGAYLEWNAKEIAHMNTMQKYGDYVIQASPQPTSRNREAIPCQGK